MYVRARVSTVSSILFVHVALFYHVREERENR